MLFARVVAALSLIVPSSVAPELPEPSPLVQVVCPTSPFTASMGTAFKIARNLAVSVKHVTDNPVCFINGQPIKAWEHPSKDFSLIEIDLPGKALKIDCGGFVKDRKYLAEGYARGLPFVTTVGLTGTGQSDAGFSILTGIFTVVPGMSGGVVVDAETGAAVGTINVHTFETGLSGSVPFKETSLCQS